jgi:hypothetical protein
MFVVVAAVAALALAGAAAADQSFNDSTGETAGSADISTVAVSNDPASGTITFAVTTNMTTLETNSEIDILVDSDKNPATGGAGAGLDYLFGVDPSGGYFTKWDGSKYADVPITDAAVGFSNGTLVFRVSAADLGNTTGFNFAVLTFRGPDPNNPIVDQAPDSGLWTYNMVTAPPPPTTTTTPPPPPAPVTVNSVTATYAGVPTHGKTFRVTGLTVDLSNGTEVKASSLKCSATLGGAHLAGTGTGGCTFHLSAKAKGKKLTIKVTGKYKAKTVANTVSFKVK